MNLYLSTAMLMAALTLTGYGFVQMVEYDHSRLTKAAVVEGLLILTIVISGLSLLVSGFVGILKP